MLSSFIKDVTPRVEDHLKPENEITIRPYVKIDVDETVKMIEGEDDVFQEESKDQAAPGDMKKMSSYDPQNYTEDKVVLFNENVEMCHFCGRTFSDEDREKESVRMFQSTNCFHTYHIQCFKVMADHDLCTVNRSKEEFEFKEALCAACSLPVASWECKEILGEDKWEDIEKRRLDIVTASDPKLVKCTCGNVVELNPGVPDYTMKDAKD